MTEQTNIDTFDNLCANASSGSAGMKLFRANGDVSVLRTNAILQEREWVDLDKRVIQIAQDRLALTNILTARGLTYNLGGLGATVSQWQVESDLTDAVVNMEADSIGSSDILTYQTQQVPIPIISKDFKIGIRALQASRKMGSNIDLTNADAAARKVAVGIEDLLIKGHPNKFVGSSIYGVTTHPARIPGTATGTWASDIANIYSTVLAMITAADQNQRYGPFALVVASGLSPLLYNVYDDGSGQTVAQRLKNIDSITDVVVSDRMPAGNVALVQLTSDTIDIAIGQTLSTVEWDSQGGMSTTFKVLTALAPRIKPDANGKLGIVHFTGC